MATKEELIARLAECVLEMEDEEVVDVANEYIEAGYEAYDGIMEGLVAGMNKVAGDLNAAIARARNVAAPANAQRFNIKTPCAVNGQCGDCTSPDCICAQMVITRFSKIKGRIKVVLVGEDLGL